MISMVWPDIDVTMSPGRCALPSGMFSTRPIDADRVDLGLARGERLHQPDDAGRARHVALHVLHAGGRLDRDAAGVEAHALADEGDRRVALLAAVPAHDHDAAVARASPARRRAARSCRASSSPARRAPRPRRRAFFSALRAAGEFFRIEHVGRLVDQVARHHDAVGDRLARAHRPCARRRHRRRAIGDAAACPACSSSSLRLVL